MLMLVDGCSASCRNRSTAVCATAVLGSPSLPMVIELSVFDKNTLMSLGPSPLSSRESLAYLGSSHEFSLTA
ncbi:hypothetical protein T05_11439 [Trichinella murrelli]|uniref:Uncharacterized protein n=1 Tax=Trichinella murrelli TaxID=144512 RepID=A0A0V0U2Z8_9BILA|nr:hypothetical protein T05_11439 [Trichinella murrelli]